MSEKTVTLSLQEILDMTDLEYGRLPEEKRTEILQKLDLDLDRIGLPQNKPKMTELRASLLQLGEMSQEDWDDLGPKTQRKILRHLDLLDSQAIKIRGS